MKEKERMKKPTTSLPIIEYSSSSSYGCSSPGCDVPSLVLESENWKRVTVTLHGGPVVMAGKKKWTHIVPV
jgi:hypothetical protein